MSSDPWTVYWHGDNLNSCIASASAEDSEAIAQIWKDFARALEDGAKVLDLACGNGAIPKILLANNSNLEICAVDKASIDPQKFLSNFGELSRVKFLAEIDICELPFDAEAFDAVTSQFGLEYAPLVEAAQSAARVLKNQGSLRLLMHHEESEVVRPAKASLAEMGRLLEAGGVMEGIGIYIDGKITLQQLEAIGQVYLESEGAKTPQISGQIFAGINTIIDVVATDSAKANLLMTTMKTKLLADQSRLQQLSAAALNKVRKSEIQVALNDSGIEIQYFAPLLIESKNSDGNPEQVLIGWQLEGIKR